MGKKIDAGASRASGGGPQLRQEHAVWLLIAVGVALRLWQLAGGASLWLDEIQLARNIADRDYLALLRPLNYAQVAPPGFLFVERLLWSAFQTDWSLRLVPLAGAIISLFLLRALARRALTGVAVPLAVASCAVAVPHILFAGQVKQYSTDVTWALALVLLAARILGPADPPRSRYVIAGAVGFAAVWFSSAAVLVVTGLGAALTLLAFQQRVDRQKTMGLVVAPWAIGAGAASIAARLAVSARTMSFMREFWHDAFAPVPPRSLQDLLWPWHRLTELFGMPWGLRYPLAYVYSVLALAGFVLLWRARRDITLLLLGPIIVTFGVAAAHLYPFEGRLVLYLTPTLFLAMAAAIGALARWAGARIRFAAPAVILLAVVPVLMPIIRYRPPYRIQEMDTLLEWLTAHRRPGDVVYVWYRSVPNLLWYGPRHGLGESDVVEGGCWVAEPRGFLREIDRLRGRPRVWIVLTGTSLPEARLMMEYAGQIGIRGEGRRMPASFPRYHLEAWLHDFSDSTRLATTSAEQFPVRLPAPARHELMACKDFFGL
jgi:hypothetical protein